MNYYLFKMDFSTSLHIGESTSARSLETINFGFCADTFFSALCHMAISMDGVAGIDKLVNAVKMDNIAFSDAFPYNDDILYIPKPCLSSTQKAKQVEKSNDDKKKMKKLNYIPILELDNFIKSIKGEDTFMISNITNEFGQSSVSAKVSIYGFEETQPYSVGLWNFNKDCGLYMIIGYSDEETLEYVKRLITLLSINGIGGKTSSGYGKFEVCDEIELGEICDDQTEILNKLLQSKSNANIAMTTSLPKDTELDDSVKNATYVLTRRSGFVSSAKYAKASVKKSTQYFFAAGSVFERPFSGDVYDVGLEGAHPVYRYSKPMFLGVEI